MGAFRLQMTRRQEVILIEACDWLPKGSILWCQSAAPASEASFSPLCDAAVSTGITKRVYQRPNKKDAVQHPSDFGKYV